MSAELTPATPEPRPRKERRRSVVGPLILILLGMLFLAMNFGLLNWGFWTTIWRLWPLILILVGLELVFGRSSWVAGIAVLVVVVVVGAVIATAGFAGQYGGYGPMSWNSDRPASLASLDEPLGDSRRATVDLKHGAGSVFISALPADSGRLIQADLGGVQADAALNSVRRRGDTAEILLRDSGPQDWTWRSPQGGDWTLKLAQRIPMDLAVDAGASSLDLNLTDLNVTALDINLGVGEARVAMPKEPGRLSTRLKGGVSSVEVSIPQGVAARIRSRSGLTEINVDQARFPKAGEYYQSPNFDSASSRIDLDVRTGVGSISVR